MSIYGLVNGSLFRAPEWRVSKSGQHYVKTVLKELASGEPRWLAVAAFSETAQSELMRLDEGDAVSVSGPLSPGIYTAADGSQKLSLHLVADRVLPLREPPHGRKPRPQEPAGSGDRDGGIDSGAAS